jgi:glyceraldehyde 3-phosphate dehydrogenase
MLSSLMPTVTGSAAAISLIYPELKGKRNGVATRVPHLNASLTDCVFEVERETTIEEVHGLLRRAAHRSLNGILGFATKPLIAGPVKSNRMQKKCSHSTATKT